MAGKSGLTLYASGFSRSRRPLWALEEVGAAYDVVELQFPPKVHHPEYLAINPAGAVPALVDGDLMITESLAICDHVSRRFGGTLTVDPGQPGYLDYLQLLLYGESTLAVTVGWARRFGPLHKDAMADARDSFTIRLELLQRSLADGREFLVADRLTLADISVAFPLRLASGFGFDPLMSPEITAYRDRLMARPACLRAYAR